MNYTFKTLVTLLTLFFVASCSSAPTVDSLLGRADSHAESITDGHFTRALVLIEPQANANPLLADNDLALEHQLEALGARVVHRLSGRAFVCELSNETLDVTLSDVERNINGARVFTSEVEQAFTSESLSSVRFAADVWNAWLGSQKENLNGPAGQIPPNLETSDVIGLGKYSPSLSAEAPLAAPSRSTNSFFAGRIAVGLILVESNGSRDQSTRDWTDSERAIAVSQIMRGLDWWTQRAPQGRPVFVYDNAEGQLSQTGYEPADHNAIDDGNPSEPSHGSWLCEIILPLVGLPTCEWSNPIPEMRVYSNQLRTKYHSDWAVTYVVAQGQRFKDNFSAFAPDLNAPYVVMLYDNGGWGSKNLHATAAHEFGHLFGANDEYYEAHRSCSENSGYLYIGNRNTEYFPCESALESSIMRGNPPHSFDRGEVDKWALAQMGIRDSDNDGIIDPLDVTATIETPVVTQIQKMSCGPGKTLLVLKGRAFLNPFPSPNPDLQDATINTIQNVDYRFNAGPWFSVRALDGALNADVEEFELITVATESSTTPLLSAHVEIRVTDNLGNVSAQAFSVEPSEDVDSVELTNCQFLPGIFKP